MRLNPEESLEWLVPNEEITRNERPYRCCRCAEVTFFRRADLARIGFSVRCRDCRYPILVSIEPEDDGYWALILLRDAGEIPAPKEVKDA